MHMLIKECIVNFEFLIINRDVATNNLIGYWKYPIHISEVFVYQYRIGNNTKLLDWVARIGGGTLTL